MTKHFQKNIDILKKEEYQNDQSVVVEINAGKNTVKRCAIIILKTFVTHPELPSNNVLFGPNLLFKEESTICFIE